MIQTFYLVHDEARRRAHEALSVAQDGTVVQLRQPQRNSQQNALLHARLVKRDRLTIK